MEQKKTFDKLAKYIGIASIILLTILLINYLGSVLLPFFIAWLLAYLLYPIVSFVQYKLKVPTRALSIVVTLIFVTIILLGIFYFIIPPMIEQFIKLGELAMKYLNDSMHVKSFPELIGSWINRNKMDIEHFFQSGRFIDTLKTTAPKLFEVIGQTANIVLGIIASLITLLYMFFILMDYEYLCKNWIKIFPQKNRPFWETLANNVKVEMNNYIRGQSLVSLIMAIMFCIGFTIIDFPMAIGLGILIGIMNLIPYLHTLALVPTIILALFKAADTGENFWIIFGLALIVFAVVQAISDLIVTPRVMGKAMRLNPAILLLSLSIWGTLLGFIGLIIALPLTTLLMAYYQMYITKDKPI